MGNQESKSYPRMVSSTDPLHRRRTDRTVDHHHRDDRHNRSWRRAHKVPIDDDHEEHDDNDDKYESPPPPPISPASDSWHHQEQQQQQQQQPPKQKQTGRESSYSPRIRTIPIFDNKGNSHHDAHDDDYEEDYGATVATTGTKQQPQQQPQHDDDDFVDFHPGIVETEVQPPSPKQAPSHVYSDQMRQQKPMHQRQKMKETEPLSPTPQSGTRSPISGIVTRAKSQLSSPLRLQQQQQTSRIHSVSPLSDEEQQQQQQQQQRQQLQQQQQEAPRTANVGKKKKKTVVGGGNRSDGGLLSSLSSSESTSAHNENNDTTVVDMLEHKLEQISQIGNIAHEITQIEHELNSKLFNDERRRQMTDKEYDYVMRWGDEMLTRQMIQLDAIVGDDEVRKHRKRQIKRIQHLLSKLDELKSSARSTRTGARK